MQDMRKLSQNTGDVRPAKNRVLRDARRSAARDGRLLCVTSSEKRPHPLTPSRSAKRQITISILALSENPRASRQPQQISRWRSRPTSRAAAWPAELSRPTPAPTAPTAAVRIHTAALERACCSAREWQRHLEIIGGDKCTPKKNQRAPKRVRPTRKRSSTDVGYTGSPLPPVHSFKVIFECCAGFLPSRVEFIRIHIYPRASFCRFVSRRRRRFAKEARQAHRPKSRRPDATRSE